MAGPLHTAGNAVPSLDGTELGGLLDDLTGFDEGIDLICDGIRNIALRRLPVDRVQLLIATIAGSPDATDVIGAFGRLAERIADADNTPALRSLPLDAQKKAQRQGELTAHALTDPDLRQPASKACAALDTPPTWRCRDCDTYNTAADHACHTCGTTPTRTARDQPDYTPIRHCTNCGWSTDNPTETTCDCPPYFTPTRKD